MVPRGIDAAAPARVAEGMVASAWHRLWHPRAPDPRADDRRAWRLHWRALLARLLAREGAGGWGWRWGRQRRALARRPWILLARVPGLDEAQAQTQTAGPAGRWIADGEPVLLARAVVVPVAWPVGLDDALPGEARAHPALAAWRRCVSRPPPLVVVLRLPMALLAADAGDARARVARIVRHALRGLREGLGVHCPVHVLVEDVDALPGFDRFLGLTPRARRDRPWGWAEDASATGPAGFDAWWARLESDALARFHACTDPDPARARRRRVDLFALPRGVQAWRAGWTDWRQRLVDPAGEDEAPWLRGVWLTGRPAFTGDRAVSRIASGTTQALLEIERPFLGELFAAGWPAEARLARPSAAWRRRRDRRRRAWRGALALLALLACGSRAVAWWQEAARVRGLDREARSLAEASAAGPDAASLLVALDGMARDGAAVAARAAMPGWRPDAATRAVRRAALAARSRLAGDVWWPRWQSRLVARLSESPGRETSDDDRYEALRVQRMLHEPAHYDARAVAAWWRADRAGRAATHEGDEIEAAVLQRLLEAGPPATLPEAPGPAVSRARAALRDRPLADAVRARWRHEESPRWSPSTAFRISEAAGPDAALVFRRLSGAPLSAALPAGCDAASRQRLAQRAPALAQALAEEAGWVLGEPWPDGNRADRLRATVGAARRAQAAEAAREWHGLLDDLRLGPASSGAGDDLAALASRLSQPDSPLQRLVVAVAHAWAGAPDPAAPGGTVAPGDDLADDEGPRWRRWAADPAQATSPLARLRDAFREAATQWRLPEGDRAAPILVPGGQAADDQLRAAAADAPAPVRRWIEDLVARREASGRVRNARAWQSAADEDVGGWCRQAIAGRYPFAAGGRDDVPLADLAALFAPGGRFDQFVAGHAATGGGTGNGLAAVPPGLRATLAGAARVRDAFFGAARAPSGGAGPAPWPPLSASLRLASVTPTGATVQVTAAGRTTTFRSPDDPPLHWTWPDGAPTAVALALVPPPAEGRPPATVASAAGPWALFRLLDAGHVRPVAPGRPAERLALSFAGSGVQATFEWQADSVRHPWGLEALRAFRCPASAAR